MNREIKFRGMTIKGEWVYGLLAQIPQEYHTQSIPAGVYISNKAGRPFAYQVRPETVGQYTGLVDKQGVKIFEGDIVKIYLGLNIWQTKEVYFDNDLCEFGFKETHENLYSMYSKHYEVIGNIHEEPKA